MNAGPPDLEAIKARLVRAGYPRPAGGEPAHETRAVTREAQEARAELREHIIEDIWALIQELESRRQGAV
jgi:hypothetical protein